MSRMTDAGRGARTRRLQLALAGMLLPGLALAAPPGPQAGSAASGDEAADIARAGALVDAADDHPGTLAQARALLDGVLSAHPASAAAHLEVARIHIREAFDGTERDPDGLAKAEAALDRAVELDPGFAEARVLRGRLYRLQGRRGEAHAEFDAADALGGASPWLHVNRGQLLNEEGRHEAALEACGRVPADVRPVRTRRAADRCMLRALEALQRAGEAEAVYLAALERDPAHAPNHAAYARFLLCRAGRPDAAAERALAALELDAGNWQAHATLGAALHADWARRFREGDADAEARAFVRAQQGTRGDPVLDMHLQCGATATLDLLRALRDSGRMPPIPALVAVLSAARVEDAGMPVIVAFTVAGAGRDAHNVYLNSEADYREPHALTLRFGKDAAQDWRTLHGEEPEALKGRDVTVVGYVRRVRVDFTQAGMPTGKYYYQTHLEVREPWQVMVGAPPEPPMPPAGARHRL